MLTRSEERGAGVDEQRAREREGERVRESGSDEGVGSGQRECSERAKAVRSFLEMGLPSKLLGSTAMKA